MVWLYVCRCAPDSGSAPHICQRLWAARHAMPLPWEQVQGLVRSGADFEARRWSMNGADLRALEVFGEWATTEKAVVQDPGVDF